MIDLKVERNTILNFFWIKRCCGFLAILILINFNHPFLKKLQSLLEKKKLENLGIL